MNLGTQIKNGINTSTVILLKTKCLVRLIFRQLFFLGGGGMLLISTELQLPGDFAASLTTESHLRLRGLALTYASGKQCCGSRQIDNLLATVEDGINCLAKLYAAGCGCSALKQPEVHYQQ